MVHDHRLNGKKCDQGKHHLCKVIHTWCRKDNSLDWSSINSDVFDLIVAHTHVYVHHYELLSIRVTTEQKYTKVTLCLQRVSVQ